MGKSKKKNKKAGGIVIQKNNGPVQTKEKHVEQPSKKKQKTGNSKVSSNVQGNAKGNLEQPFGPVAPPGIDSKAFEWLIYPITPEQFFAEYWEKKPLHVKRNNPDYYDGLFTKGDNDNLLCEGKAVVNLAKVNKEGRKVMKNLNGNKEDNTMEHVNKCWKDGYSVQVLHPQQHHVPVAQLLSALESDTKELWGSNSYITPGGARGFAPHYDDVEVFMCQLEGAKHWQLFRPPASDTNNQMELPKTFSIDFLQSDFNDGDALFDGLLEQGDLLYMPRGTVHTGRTPEDVDFSHHLTVSTYQASAWSDFLNECLPGAIENATRNDRRFREGLPLRYLNYMGSCFKKKESDADLPVIEQRKAFRKHLKTLLKELENHIDPDDAADLRGSDFVVARLNPTQIKDDDEESDLDEETAEYGPAPSFVAPTALDLEASGLQVRWRDPTWVRLALDVNTETGETEVLLNHCLKNDRARHMAGGDSHGADAPNDTNIIPANNQEMDEDEEEIDEDELPSDEIDLGNPPAEQQEIGSLRFEEMFFHALRGLCRSGPQRTWIPAQGLGGLDKSDCLELLELLWQEQLLETRVAGKKRMRATDDIPV